MTINDVFTSRRLRHRGQRLWGLVLFALLVLAAATALAGADDDYQKAKDAQLRLQKSESAQKRRDEWLKVAEAFEKVIEKHGKGKQACDARYNLGKTYAGLYESSHAPMDRKAAAKAYESLAENCKDSKLADDALYNGGALRAKGKETALAKTDLKMLLVQFPKSEFRPKAEELLAELDPAFLKTLPKPEPKAEAKAEPQPSAPAPEKAAAPAPDAIEEALKSEAKAERRTPQLAKIDRFTVNRADDETLVELHFTRLPAFARGEIPAVDDKPRRLFFDFLDTVQNDELALPKPENDPRLGNIRASQFKPTILRLVFDLSPNCGDLVIENDQAAALARIHFRAKGAAPYKAPAPVPVPAPPVAEAAPKPAPAEVPYYKLEGKEPPKPSPPPPKPAPQANEPLPIVQGAPSKLPPRNQALEGAGKTLKRVVIDPGHGGKDDGAIGRGGTMEKDLTLQIAFRLKQILERDQGLQVVLTRDHDEYLALYDRTKIANDLDADLFVSIHCNANRAAKHRGIETFYLNNSSDSYSRRLAERENQELGQPISDLDFILTDLSMNVNITESIALADQVQKSIVRKVSEKYSDIDDRGVHRAVFHVLLYARMPAILVETSFLSNPIEEKRLRSPNYQEELAQGIADGLRSYSSKQGKLARGGL